jgi:hypothetical protein
MFSALSAIAVCLPVNPDNQPFVGQVCQQVVQILFDFRFRGVKVFPDYLADLFNSLDTIQLLPDKIANRVQGKNIVHGRYITAYRHQEDILQYLAGYDMVGLFVYFVLHPVIYDSNLFVNL